MNYVHIETKNVLEMVLFPSDVKLAPLISGCSVF